MYLKCRYKPKTDATAQSIAQWERIEAARVAAKRAFDDAIGADYGPQAKKQCLILWSSTARASSATICTALLLLTRAIGPCNM